VSGYSGVGRAKVSAEVTKALTDEAAAVDMYSPASEADIDAALTRCTEALELIPYMEVEEGIRQESQREMIRIRCRTRTDSFALDMVEIDVSTVWRAVLVAGNSSMQNVVDAEDGFDFRFAILAADGTYLTGLIEVRQPVRDRIRLSRLARISAK
jgi:hypothetical protein